MLYSLQQIKIETVLATVEKKNATELLEGKGTVSVLVED